MTIERFIVVDSNGETIAEDFDTYDEARSFTHKFYGSDQRVAIVARIFEYSDSELVWTSDGSNSWPPKDSPVWTNSGGVRR